MIVTMDRYTRYYVNQSGDGEINPVYRDSFRMQRGNGIGAFFGGLFRLVKSFLYLGAKPFGKEALKRVLNIITDILIKEPEQPVVAIFKNRFIEAKGNLEEKIQKNDIVWLGFKKEAQVEKCTVSRQT